MIGLRYDCFRFLDSLNRDFNRDFNRDLSRGLLRGFCSDSSLKEIKLHTVKEKKR